MVMRNTCLRPHNRCTFNGLSLSMQRAELWYYKEKMNRIPDDSRRVFASMSAHVSIDVKDYDLNIVSNSPLILNNAALKIKLHSDLVWIYSPFSVLPHLGL